MKEGGSEEGAKEGRGAGRKKEGREERTRKVHWLSWSLVELVTG